MARPSRDSADAPGRALTNGERGKLGILAWVKVAIWMIFIYALSTHLGSPKHSAQIVEPVVRRFDPAVTVRNIDSVHHFVRKTAHFVVYGILGTLLLSAIRPSISGAEEALVKSGILAWLAASAFGASDEYHQLFVSGREAKIGDILVDSIGAFFAIVLCVMALKKRGVKAV